MVKDLVNPTTIRIPFLSYVTVSINGFSATCLFAFHLLNSGRGLARGPALFPNLNHQPELIQRKCESFWTLMLNRSFHPICTCYFAAAKDCAFSAQRAYF